MTIPVADLELNLRRRDAVSDAGRSYAVEMIYSPPGSDTDTRVGFEQPVTVSFDSQPLLAASADPAAYARALTGCLFADNDFRTAFSNARTAAQSQGQALRIRLLVDYAAPELLNLRWEALLDPDLSAPLFTGEQTYFSRFLVSRDWRPVNLKPKGDLRTLVAVANPDDLTSGYSLAAIDVPGEITRAKAGLGDMAFATLPTLDAGGAPSGRCTLNGLVDLLRQGGPDGQGFDILFLVCHGAYKNEEPWLLLDDDTGKVARVPGADLARRINELENRPRLIVLASCESAGDSTGQAFTALGPRLAEAGVPAVVAMQGAVSVATMSAFLPVFFSELDKDGQIDRALAVARGTVRDRADYWMPVLFMRLKSGRLWYTPGFGEENGGFNKWDSLITNLKRGMCTAIVGPGVSDALLGTNQQIAASWADRYRYPLETHERDHLPQVAQYLAIQQSDLDFPRFKLIEFLRQRIINGFGSLLPDPLKAPEASLDAMLEAIMQARAAMLAARGRIEPHQFLASLPVPIYITTAFSNLLAAALKAAGKTPKVTMCPWNDVVDQKTAGDDINNFTPTVSTPLVYHLFGRFDLPESLVLTEDDYFDFLIGVTRNQDLIPPYVRKALVSTSLLFVGFQLAEWDFRVFYRSIINQEGGMRRSRQINVGVQVDQEGGDIADPERARDYLESYFDNAAIRLYWGSAEDFIQDLAGQMKGQP